MTNYRRGVQKERECQREFEERGCITARTAGSHGLFDVVCYCPDGVYLIQVKRVKKGKSWQGEYREAKAKLQSLAAFPNVHCGIWVWEDGKGWVVREIVTRRRKSS